ncbi:Belongs to the helicase [Dionaea muscipula]
MDDILVYELVPQSPAPSPPALTSLPLPLQVYTRDPRSVISWGSVDATEPAPTGPAPSSLDSSPAAPLPAGAPEPALTSTTPLSLDSSPAGSLSSDLDVPTALRKGQRSCATYPMSDHISYAGVSSSLQAFISQLDSISISRFLSEAISSLGWGRAMVEEMEALVANQIWDLVSLPPGKWVIDYKWVYVVEVHPDGFVARLKARLVAKGYAQVYSLDYRETFSPVAKMVSVRLLISLAASSGWPLHQFDIKNAFFHGDLQEEVYMKQPSGFVAQGESGHVCWLKKSLHGLKQSPRAWFGRFSSVVLEFGLQRLAKDHSVFYDHSDARCLFLVVYVDDIVITGSDDTQITALKAFLQQQFHTKDIGSLRYFLGIEVARCQREIFLPQLKYALDLLYDTRMLGTKPNNTPMLPGMQLIPEEGDAYSDPDRYRHVVGRLNYWAITQPDIAFL